MSFQTKLIELLKTNSKFVDDEGELLLAAVQDHAWKIDHDLVKLLLSDKEIKTKFFDEIEPQSQERERERERERETLGFQHQYISRIYFPKELSGQFLYSVS